MPDNSRLTLVNADAVRDTLKHEPLLALQEVERAYASHGRGETVNPPSNFLSLARGNRVIALQGATTDPSAVGAKLIASYPDNIRVGMPRASAVIVLNDPETGVPTTILEGGQISAARTAASAVFAARRLSDPEAPSRDIALVGAGTISNRIVETFAADSWRFEEIGCFDREEANARAFSKQIQASCGWRVKVLCDLREALQANMVVFATTAPTPYVTPPFVFRPGQIVLNISLRDIGPELLLAAANIVDDVDHCLTADTSPHLAEKLIGDRRFISGTLADVLAGRITVDHTRPIVFSPFGMGILDLTLAHAVARRAEANGQTIHLENFMGGNDRWS